MATDERAQAALIANRLLDEPNADPDDDMRVLARQFERSCEQVVQLTRERNEWLRLLRIVREADGLSGRDAVDTVLAGSPEGFVQAERERLKR